MDSDMSLDDLIKILFDDLDKDKKGYVTTQELTTFQAENDDPIMREILVLYDLNKDGKIDYKEFSKCFMDILNPEKDGMYQTFFSYYDQDKDGFMTKDDFEKFYNSFGDKDKNMWEIFDTLDADKDGKLTQQEFLKASEGV